MTDIFISYKREEQHIARQIADLLESRGWSVWWDPKIRAGERYDDVIHEALSKSRCVIVIWSRMSINSTYVKDEASYARERGKLVPLAVEKVELPFRFEGIHTEQLYDWRKGEQAKNFNRLTRSIRELAPEPQEEVSPTADSDSLLLDLLVVTEIDLEEAATGTAHRLKVNHRHCLTCGGSTAHCETIRRGVPCAICGSQKYKLEVRTLKLKVPAGVDTGDRLRLTGKGNFDPIRDRTGDLYVHVKIRPHEIFTRDGKDLFVHVLITPDFAQKGGQLNVPTLDGNAKFVIPPKTQCGKLFRLRGKGMTLVREKGVGDLICEVEIARPEDVID